jgi:flagellar hook assembly protein FlgD
VAPHPFNPRTTVTFALERAGHVELAVYDVAGRLVRTLVSGSREAGEHRAVWDGRDEQGRAAPSGAYLCRVRAGGSVESRGLVLAK